jgi:electron transfer flavoprotein beta subunit
MGARTKPLEKVAAGDVGIDASLVGGEAARVQCGDFHAPEAKPPGQIIEDEDTNETVEKIVAWLAERKLI